MLLPDVNVLIYAHVEDSSLDHARYANWIIRLATGREPFALSVLVLSGFVRVVTNARIFDPPSTLERSFAFVTSLVERPGARIVGPGPDHLEIFERLCHESGAAGKLVADAQHAAIAVEHGCTMVSTDSQDFDGSIHCVLAGCGAIPSTGVHVNGLARQTSPGGATD